ncbi:MAG TPA: hypothetical protein VIS96_13105 [Terrimicrobiaceae bacterium]
MKSRITFQWIDPCPSDRLRAAQQRLLESVEALGLEAALFPAGPEMIKLADILSYARRSSSGDSFVWCNSDVLLTQSPFTITDRTKVHGFHRRELPSGDICGGTDMYLFPNAIWDNILSKDVPDLWCGATHVDWWLTRASSLLSDYESHIGFIDHVSHDESGASKIASDPHYRHNLREYNAWARRNGAGTLEGRVSLPLIGSSMSPLRDYVAWAMKKMPWRR